MLKKVKEKITTCVISLALFDTIQFIYQFIYQYGYRFEHIPTKLNQVATTNEDFFKLKDSVLLGDKPQRKFLMK